MKKNFKEIIGRARNKGDIQSKLELISCFRQLFEVKVSTAPKNKQKDLYNSICMELLDLVFKSKEPPTEIEEYFKKVPIEAFQASCLEVPLKYYAIKAADYCGKEEAIRIYEPFFLEIIERSNIPAEDQEDAYNSLVLELLSELDQVSRNGKKEEKVACFMLFMAPEIAISGTMVPTDHSIKGKMCNIEVDDTGSIFIDVTA